ncbi:hypothetical protein K7X08_001109 [Anisodus acutangulus]|uniref:Uncharacterized protein n=1 Tax=Anisodus acutangulus TaxID=402998 RepID=A0A9Q1RMQ1_9SOLA|nr:hypothetical protein K7X08_001109 [Anisodus acutangulus]
MHLVSRYPSGAVASRPGEFLAGCGSFKATTREKDGHAAIPHDSVDPILTASTSVISLQSIVSREIDPLESQILLQAIKSPWLNDSTWYQIYLVRSETFCGRVEEEITGDRLNFDSRL